MPESKPAYEYSVRLEGLGCTDCIHKVTEALMELEGVVLVDTSLSHAWVHGHVDEKQLIQILEDLGYSAEIESVRPSEAGE